ncbi:hypothetical protein [Mycobacteroides abscessus]|uniref:hypothetical protein n=1 Tax=unclassified Desemzia TaxID=2685243 RepID=UPI00104A785B
MVNRKLKQDLEKASYKRPSDFWGTQIAVVSILYGEFIFRVDGFLIANAEPYLSQMPEDLIGIILVVLGILKSIGLFFQYRPLKKYSIWLLSGMWSGLFFVALTYSFGTGYPHPSYIFIGMIAVGCFRVSLKGDYSA